MSKFSTSRMIIKNTTWHDFQVSKHTMWYINMKKVVISDCDGILTDGNLTYDKDGKSNKTYGCHDKELYKLGKALGWDFVFVTNDNTGYNITSQRLKSSFGESCEKKNPKERVELVKEYKDKGYMVVFLGDSPSDLEAGSMAHVSASTKNCFEPIKKYFNFISDFEGGHGGFADILYHLFEIPEEDLKYFLL